jgi:hypothetical protein
VVDSFCSYYNIPIWLHIRNVLDVKVKSLTFLNYPNALWFFIMLRLRRLLAVIANS